MQIDQRLDMGCLQTCPTQGRADYYDFNLFRYLYSIYDIQMMVVSGPVVVVIISRPLCSYVPLSTGT